MEPPSSRRDNFWLKYRSALEAYLLGDREDALEAAMALGEEGFNLEKGFLSLVETHFESLLDIQGHLGPENTEKARRFLRKVLAFHQAVPQIQIAPSRGIPTSEKVRFISDLVSRIVHEFNNLLTIVRGTVQIASGKMQEDSPGLREMKEIATVSERAEHIARELVVFNRRYMENRDWIDLNECVREFLKHFTKLAVHGYTISVELAEDLWRIRCHPEQIRRILMNLFLNASEAISWGGEIIVRTENCAPGSLDGPEEKPGGGCYVCFSIEDNGLGPESATRERALAPFVSAGLPFKGTGLRMAIVNGILSVLEGWLEVERRQGRGRKVRLFLPARRGSQGAVAGAWSDRGEIG